MQPSSARAEPAAGPAPPPGRAGAGADLQAPARHGLRGRLRFLARDSAFYGAASALHKLFTLVTLPLLARAFSVADYGRLDFFNVVAVLLGGLAVFGQDSALVRYLHEHADAPARRQLVSQSLALQLGCSLLLVAVLWLVQDALPLPFERRPEDTLLVRLVLLQLPFLVLANFAQNLLKWSFARVPFAVVTLGSVAVNAAALAVGLLWLQVGLAGVLAIALAVRGVFALVGLWLCRGWLAVPDGWGFLPTLLPYAVPFGVLGVVGGFVPALERAAVSSARGAGELGLYAVGFTVASVLMLAVQAFQMAWTPFSLAIHKQADAGRTYGHVLKGFSLALCLLALAVAGAAPLLVELLASDRYAGAAQVVLPVALGLAVQGIGWVTEVGIAFSRRSHLQLAGYAGFLAVAGGGAWLLAGPFGIAGVAWAVALGHAVKAAVNTLLAQRAHPLPWPYVPVLVLLAATVAAGVAVQQAAGALPAWLLAPAVLAGLALLVAVAWAWLFDAEERGHLAALARALARGRLPRD